MASRDKLFTEVFSTERVGVTVGGLEPNPTSVLSGVVCLPLYPVDMNIKISLGVDPSVNLQAVITHGDMDILQGDILIVDSGRYSVKFVDSWNWRPSGYYYNIFIEEALV